VKKILLPINFSSCSINALHYAGHIAEKFEATLLILNALDEETTSVDINNVEKSPQIDRISKLINDDPHLVNILTDILVTEKSKKEAILWAVDTFGIDLIIMGTDGIQSPYDELAGTFSYKIVSSSTVPVLTIPPEYQYQSFNKIGFGVDYKHIDHTSLLDIILEFAYSYGSEIEMFHIEKYIEEKELLEVYESAKLNDYFQGVNHHFMTIKNQSLWEGLKEYIEVNQPDLLAIMPRKYSFFDWLSHDSLSKEVIQHIKLPVLTFPDK
ncbi:universal stress protein, partial [Fulvivirga lutimaris]|uniref:universal stress protein n=1 Tax=Fulvivirga lutimaris TaxID=1819566 RepID=UPI0012BC561C